MRCRKVEWLRSCVCAFALLAGSTACDSVKRTTAIPEEEANQVYWSLQLNHHAITLSSHAPWNTMQLVATPLTYEDEVLPTEGATISYVSVDTNAVSVTPDGTVLAKTATGGGTVRVIVRLTLGTITHADTALVKVMNTVTPGTLKSFSIQPGPDDSAKVDQIDATGIGLDLSRFLDRPNQNGSQMTELIVYYRSLDKQVTTVDRETGVVLNPGFRRVGDARVIATVYAYGVSFIDTVLVTIGYPLGVNVGFFERLRADGQGLESYHQGGERRTIGVGGLVIMTNVTGQPVELRFEDTTGLQLLSGACAGPSLELLFPPRPTGPNEVPCDEYLLFTQPGTYRYQDLRSGLSGVIDVIDERRLP